MKYCSSRCNMSTNTIFSLVFLHFSSRKISKTSFALKNLKNCAGQFSSEKARRLETSLFVSQHVNYKFFSLSSSQCTKRENLKSLRDGHRARLPHKATSLTRGNNLLRSKVFVKGQSRPALSFSLSRSPGTAFASRNHAMNTIHSSRRRPTGFASG